MAACVPRRIEEGNKQDQAVAACLNMWRNRDKEVGVDEKAVWSTAMVNDLPDSCFLYVEPGEKDGEGKTVPRSKRHLPYKDSGGKVDLPHLRNAISRLGQPGTGTGWLSESLRTRLLARARKLLAGQQKSLTDRAVDWLKQAWGLTEDLVDPDSQETKETPNSFMAWKDGNQYRWLAIYSNKWRDEDHPPEILASQAHRDFVKAVDEGEWPYPEVWLWHVPGTRFGVADFVAYDESGFALASGTFDKGQERIAAFLSKQDDLAMSHGMPVKEIKREEEDPTIITRYRSIEISPLPREAAANKHGTAIELLREVKMAIPDEKRAFLADAMGEKGLQELEGKLADKAKELEDLEIQSKEEPEQEDVEDVEVEEAEPKEAEVEPTPNYVTREEMVEALAALFRPIEEQLQAVVLNVESVGEVQAEQGKAIKALQKEDEEKLKDAIANTPAASLFEQIRSAIGSEETYVDGRASLAKAGPKETQDDRQGPTPVGIINQLMSQSWGQQ